MKCFNRADQQHVASPRTKSAMLFIVSMRDLPLAWFGLRLLQQLGLKAVRLCHVVVSVGIVFVSLHVVPIDERLDSFLEVWRFDGELELVVQLGDEGRVVQGLAHLHDADYGGVDLVLAVLKNKNSICKLLDEEPPHEMNF